MAPPNEAEVPKSIVRFARFCGIFGIIQSVLWIVLYAFSMASYMNCNFLMIDDIDFQDLVGVIMHYFYFRDVDCPTVDFVEEIESLHLSVIMQPEQIFVWSTIGVSLTSIWLFTSIYLLIGVNKKTIKQAVLAIYIWSTSAALVATVDIAVGILFGVTFGEVTTVMVDHAQIVEVEAYMYDIIRYSALLLMTISFKGFALLIINVYVAIALFHKTFVLDSIAVAKTEPPRGEPIRAYGSSRRDQPSDLWHTAPPPSEFEDRASFARHPARIRTATITKSNFKCFPNRRLLPYNTKKHVSQPNTSRLQNKHDPKQYVGNHERVTSWTNQPTNVGSLPFTYLAEPRQVQPSTSSPAVSQNVPFSSWRRSNNFEPQPHVPAPDYSPVQNRKLKSALKNGY